MKRKLSIVIIVVCLAVGLSLLGYLLLSDSLRFSDYSVILKIRSKERNGPSWEPGITASAAPTTEDGHPQESSADVPASSPDQNNSLWEDILHIRISTKKNAPSSTAEPVPGGESQNSSEGNTGSNSGATEAVRVKTREEIIDYCDSELLEMWEYYTGRVEALEQEARGEYRALPAEEKTKEKKEEIVASKTDLLYALEDECDARVNELLTYIGAELRSIGEDTSVISDYRKEYADKKHAMESDYIRRFQKSVA